MKLIPPPEGQSFTPEQNNYLEGFFAGVRERAMVFADLFPSGLPGVPAAPAQQEDPAELTAEERIKREEHPLDSYYRIAENARARIAPDKEDAFRFKWHGLFFLSPVKDGLRLLSQFVSIAGRTVAFNKIKLSEIIAPGVRSNVFGAEVLGVHYKLQK